MTAIGGRPIFAGVVTRDETTQCTARYHLALRLGVTLREHQRQYSEESMTDRYLQSLLIFLRRHKRMSCVVALLHCTARICALTLVLRGHSSSEGDFTLIFGFLNVRKCSGSISHGIVI